MYKGHTNRPDSEAIANRERKAAKSSNKHGDPICMKSKILAAISDMSAAADSIFVAESAGYARRVNLSVSDEPLSNTDIPF